mmetsp:Transcript_30489/g.88627  ORF Transcript_30489/g.88627 Transcript_30489/m.88627 type:complete len:296 (+) Transcript_30489:538-1425(+)
MGMVPSGLLDPRAPLSEAFRYHHWAWMGGLVAAGTMTVQLPVMFSIGMAKARIILQMSRDGLLPRALSRIDHHGTPQFGVALLGGIAAVMSALLRIEASMALAVALVMTNYGFSCYCVLLRRLAPVHRSRQDGRGESPRSRAGVKREVVITLGGLFMVVSLCFGYTIHVPAMGRAMQITAAVCVLVLAAAVCVLTAVTKPRRANKAVIGVAGEPLLGENNEHMDDGSESVATGFLCPLFPVLPLVGMFLTMLTVAGCGWRVLLEVLGVWCFVSVFYFLYGIHYSAIRQTAAAPIE